MNRHRGCTGSGCDADSIVVAGIKQIGELPKVSVIIPVHNDALGLQVCLEALMRQTYPAERFEIIVVDNASTDCIDTVREQYPAVKWGFERKRGSYRSRNRGVRAADGQIVAFTDADCIPSPSWIEEGVRSIRRESAVGLVAGRVNIRFHNAQRPSACELYDSLCSLRQQETIRQSRFGATANLFTASATMFRVGEFDESLLSGGDREWGNRVSEAGLRLVYAPLAIVDHFARSTLQDLIRRGLRVTGGTMVTGPDAYWSLQYIWHHLVERPLSLYRQMRAWKPAVQPSGIAKVLTLYFIVKTVQLAERVRIRCGGKPRN